jgi:hypothetical protein
MHNTIDANGGGGVNFGQPNNTTNQFNTMKRFGLEGVESFIESHLR